MRSGRRETSWRFGFPRVTGYRVEPPNDRLEADFNEDHVLELTPELVGSSQVLNSGIVGEAVELNLHHLEEHADQPECFIT